MENAIDGIMAFAGWSKTIDDKDVKRNYELLRGYDETVQYYLDCYVLYVYFESGKNISTAKMADRVLRKYKEVEAFVNDALESAK